MADAELPSTWSGAARNVLGNSLWILPLVTIERLLDDHFYQGSIAGIAWIVALAAAVELHVVQDAFATRERRNQMMTWALIVVGALVLGGGILRLANSRDVVTLNTEIARPSMVIKTGLKLQFYGDHRIPTEVGADNIYHWFALFSPSIGLSYYDKDGNEIVPSGGSPRYGPTWNVFVVLKQPITYGQITTSFSNPEKMGPTQILGQTDRSFIFNTFKEMPAGVLEIRAE
jgi:hypothetical protein